MDIRKLLEPILRGTISGFILARQEKLQAIKDAIGDVRPDALEAIDLIDALAGSLRLKYDNPTECLLRMSLLEKDLERLDNGHEVDARDILSSYEEAVAKKQWRP